MTRDQRIVKGAAFKGQEWKDGGKVKPDLDTFFATDGKRLLLEFFYLVYLADKKARAYNVKLQAEDIGRLLLNWSYDLRVSEGRTVHFMSDEKRLRKREEYRRYYERRTHESERLSARIDRQLEKSISRDCSGLETQGL